MYSDLWMTDHGFIKRPTTHSLLDLIPRPFFKKETITASPEESIRKSYERMKLHSVSQLPVMDQNQLLGVIDEEDIMGSLYEDPAHFSKAVHTIMTKEIETIDALEPIENLMGIFRKGMVALVTKDEEFQGMITKVDLINHFLRKESI